MASAKVELKRAVSFSLRGMKFRKNEPQVITNAADIKYFQSAPEFSVTMLKEVKAPKAAPKKPESVPPPAADEALTQDALVKMTKASLVILGMDRLSLDIDSEMKKPDMIKAILDAQSEDGDEDDDDDDDDADGDDS